MDASICKYSNSSHITVLKNIVNMGQMYFPGESANINGFVYSHRIVEGGMTFYYTGNMRNGKRHGKGKIEGSGYEDGHRCSISFDGEWYNDEPYTGEGCSSLSNGDYWRYQVRYGNGEASFRITINDGVCEGKENVKTGKGRGVIKYYDGSRYEGGLSEYKPHGSGCITYKDGTKLENSDGVWKNGKKEGGFFFSELGYSTRLYTLRIYKNDRWIR